MTSPSRRRADAVIRFTLIVAPPERRDWAQAMRAEVANVPDSAAASFACGCLWATIRARAVSAPFILLTARWALVIGATAWSALNLWLAGRLSAADAALPATLAYVAAAIFALGALLTARLGLRATVVLATPVLVLAGLSAAGAELLLPASPHISLYQALALEDFVVLLMALLVALGVPQWVAARERIGR